MPPDTHYEQALVAKGYRTIVGIDEAGRGCWAGPVVAAAVVLPEIILQQPALLPGIDDSKALSAAQRLASYQRIAAQAVGVGVGIVPAFLIDAFGIVPATRLAMVTAFLSLLCRPDALLVDALSPGPLSLPQQVLVKGDACCFSIAAASIVAKVTRDRLMVGADAAFPGYGFAAHKGYGTRAHRSALLARGPCALHRRTFKPVLLNSSL
jgi:ribonuclease HII